MLVACAGTVDDVGVIVPDVLVLPEYSERIEIQKACARFPNAIVVAAVQKDDGRMQGKLYASGINRIDYYKVGSDGSSHGTGDPLARPPVYTSATCAIGVLICMDMDDLDSRARVLNALNKSGAPLQLLCVPANMGSQWLPGESIRGFEGVYVLVSNNHQKQNAGAQSRIFGLTGAALPALRHGLCISIGLPAGADQSVLAAAQGIA